MFFRKKQPKKNIILSLALGICAFGFLSIAVPVTTHEGGVNNQQVAYNNHNTTGQLAANPETSQLLMDAGQKGYGVSGTPTDIRETIGKIINFVLSLVGIVFFVLILYGGFLWMTASGNDEKVEKAQKIITASVIGLIIIVTAWMITNFVVFNVASKL
jgi:hypothetical protein